MMAGKLFALVLTVLVFYGVDCADPAPPTFNGSFIAWGEIVQTDPDEEGFKFQYSFEECFDADSENAAFFLFFEGHNATFIKDNTTGQTFMYSTPDDVMECLEMNETEWDEYEVEDSFLSLDVYGYSFVKFSLNKLFNLPTEFLSDKAQGAPTVYRGMPAKSWTYEIKRKDKQRGIDMTLIVTSYWSNGTFGTSAGRKIVPLGFNLTQTIYISPVFVEDYIINIYGFVPDAYDHKYFKAVEGVVCPTRQPTLQFPSVKEIKAISFHSEVALPDYQELRYVDTWFDPVNKLVRTDLERMKDEDPLEKINKRYQSEITIGKMGVVYRFGWYKGESSCEIIPISKYENDMQNLFDAKANNWKMGKLFGINDTTYTYIGKAIKRDIPCHVFQATRNDWPDKAAGVTSLWEWYFNVNMTKENVMMFRDDEFGLVSAQIKILSHPKPIYNNYRMNHHFYSVKPQDPKILDSTSFDIGRCYSDLQKRGLQFSLNVTLDHNTKILAENATSDINFLQKWKAAIYSFTKLQDHSLRVSSVRSTIEVDKMYIKFYILDVHKDLPEDAKKGMISSEDAQKNLRESIDAGEISVVHEWKKGEPVTFMAVEGSLAYQIDPKFEPVIVPTLTSPTTTQSTPDPFTLETEKPKNHIDKYIGNQPGAVAGVSITMLLVGVSIGSAGIFYKINGLPSMFRR